MIPWRASAYKGPKTREFKFFDRPPGFEARTASSTHANSLIPTGFFIIPDVSVSRVKNSDVALCVISIPELEERHRDARDSTVSQSLHVLAPLVTKETFVLFNKVDLAREPAEGYGSFLSNLIWTEDIAVKNGAEGSTGFDFRSRSWRASVTTGEGMNTFVDGLVEAIRHQYVGTFISCLSPLEQVKGATAMAPLVTYLLALTLATQIRDGAAAAVRQGQQGQF